MKGLALLLLLSSFLPCRWSFDLILSCQGSLLWCQDIIRAKQELQNYEENWRRNAPFSNSYDYQILETKHYNMVTLFAASTNTLRILWQHKHQPEIYPKHSAEFGCLKWCFLYSIFNPQPWDPNSSKFGSLFIVLLKTKVINDCTPIAIE